MFVGTHSLPEIAHLTVGDAKQMFGSLDVAGWRAEVADKIVKEVGDRLKFLVDVGLDYLTLDRSAESLSGGEAQRIRLASQVGSGLTGVMYILDEPSIGLHQRDNQRLLATLKHLRDLAIRCWWSSTTRRPFAPPTLCSTSARAPACTAARSSRRARPTKSQSIPIRSPASISPAARRSRCRTAHAA